MNSKNQLLKELKKINTSDAQKIVNRITELSSEPRPFNSIKLSNDERYRIRVGDFRILYETIDNKLVVYIVKVRHRREFYKDH